MGILKMIIELLASAGTFLESLLKIWEKLATALASGKTDTAASAAIG